MANPEYENSGEKIFESQHKKYKGGGRKGYQSYGNITTW